MIGTAHGARHHQPAGPRRHPAVVEEAIAITRAERAGSDLLPLYEDRPICDGQHYSEARRACTPAERAAAWRTPSVIVESARPDRGRHLLDGAECRSR